MKNRRAIALAAVVVAALAAVPADAAEPMPTTVVELFTSQGCSSCPPADKFLGELAKRPDLVALSIHVDYWDYIGWKDPFASPDNTRRQHDYARTLKLRYVYTPQMVIQGASHATGSDRSSVLNQIKKAAQLPRLAVAARQAQGRIEISVAGAGHGVEREPATVWLAAVDRRHDTTIKRGENGGRTLAYHNVVRNMVRVGTWTGEPLTLSTSLADLGGHPDGCAVIVQSTATGRILGAAKLAVAGS